MPIKNERNQCAHLAIHIGYAVIAVVVISDESSNSETTSEGSTTDEITRVDTIGDESNVSKYPVIPFNDFIAFLLKWLLRTDITEIFRLHLISIMCCEE
jgi:hypothetical protein